jgi:hypothetical protein
MHDLGDAGVAAGDTIRWSDCLLLVRWIGPFTIRQKRLCSQF